MCLHVVKTSGPSGCEKRRIAGVVLLDKLSRSSLLSPICVILPRQHEHICVVKVICFSMDDVSCVVALCVCVCVCVVCVCVCVCTVQMYDLIQVPSELRCMLCRSIVCYDRPNFIQLRQM
jgi:hypothetical protein